MKRGEGAVPGIGNLIELPGRPVAFALAAPFFQQPFSGQPLHGTIDGPNGNIRPQVDAVALRFKPQAVAMHGAEFGEGR